MEPLTPGAPRRRVPAAGGALARVFAAAVVAVLAAAAVGAALLAPAATAPAAASASAPLAGAGGPVQGVGSWFYLDDEMTGYAGTVLQYGDPGDEVYVADLDGDGADSLLVRRGAEFFVRDSLSSGVADRTFSYGDPGDAVLVGDWDGDGDDSLAVRRGSTYFVRHTTTSGVADVVVSYGDPGDVVLVGDWDGDGVDTLGVRRGAQYHLKDSLRTGVADRVVHYGDAGDVVLVGAWNGDGVDTLGVRRAQGPVQVVVPLGSATRREQVHDMADHPVVAGAGSTLVVVPPPGTAAVTGTAACEEHYPSRADGAVECVLGSALRPGEVVAWELVAWAAPEPALSCPCASWYFDVVVTDDPPGEVVVPLDEVQPRLLVEPDDLVADAGGELVLQAPPGWDLRGSRASLHLPDWHESWTASSPVLDEGDLLARTSSDGTSLRLLLPTLERLRELYGEDAGSGADVPPLHLDVPPLYLDVPPLYLDVVVDDPDGVHEVVEVWLTLRWR